MRNKTETVLVSVLACIFAGCSSNGFDYYSARFTTDGGVNYTWTKVDGLDNLKTTIEVLSDEEVNAKCGADREVNGCAKINLYTWTCKIYTNRTALAHEKKHCLGYSHRGDGLDNAHVQADVLRKLHGENVD